MKTIVTILLISALISCSKEKTVHPVSAAMEYFDLKDTNFKLNRPMSFDINKDGRNDLLFHTEFFVGSPDDYTEYRIVPQIESAVVASAGIPKVFNKDETIYFENNPGFVWFDDPVVLAKRVYQIELEDTYWDGAWKGKENKYLGIQLTKNDKQYNGWLKLSVVNNKGWIALHDAAVSKEPGKNIIAGKIE